MRRPLPTPSTLGPASMFRSIQGRRSMPIPVALVGAMAVAACSGADAGGRIVRADSAGIEIVTSPAADRPLAWTIEEEFRLGGDDEGPGSFTSVNYDEVGADGAGNLYVLDPQSFRIVVFAPDGTHLRSVGTEGEGPGELRFPVSFAVRADGTASVFDIGKGSMVAFDPRGEPLPQVPFSAYTEPGTIRHFALTPEGWAVARGMAGSDEDLRKIELRTWPAPSAEAPAPDTAILTELQLSMPDLADFGCMMIAFQPLFTPVVQWDTEGSTIVAVDGLAYVVKVFDLDGTFVRSIRRDLPPRAATEADAMAEAGDGMRMMSDAGPGCEATAAEVVEARGFAAELPAIRNLLLAPSGEIWVERFVPAARASDTPGPIDVFDATGAYMGTLPEGTPFPLLLLPHDRIAFSERDALDVERLVVAHVERGPAASDGPGG